MNQAVLVLEDGRVFRGQPYGATGTTLGEAVFATGMTGYQETLTDPSYAGQIVVQTAPHIGNTGVNARDEESSKVWVAGYVVRDPSRIVSNFRSENSLPTELEKYGVVGIAGIDTRALTRHLRSRGSMRAGIFSGEAAKAPLEDLVAQVNGAAKMKGLSLSDVVTTADSYTVAAEGEKIGRVAILDLGIKRSTIEHMCARGLEVVVFPARVDAPTLLAANPDAVFYSNGPGDPEAAEGQVSVLREILSQKIPFFGICFGNQLLGRALGFETYKLPFGHRGINQPVLDRKTGRVEVTAHNHGFAVKVEGGPEVESPAGFGRVTVSHVSLNDDCVEGLECLDIPAFSVQYHPEAAAGPHDSNYLFDRLVDLIKTNKVAK
ncbi:glutamine-hydrolyzing carbamoyl-phosphate synthase small subunit [Rhodoluna sp. KAS3]|uniref:glutamine-hydrolyzing carbamoyl-phosphate synthase small subunit n=1 Tax=Rhodoluna sp. KAS3 TaxID=942880 RepID=UPI0022312BD8|nr:glutamine-hydrolyzing carbamoyl-phosphate synthase small subunit [Rhodoluna sp. KAS3]BDS49037.1 carbamoyl-phosphate synthase small chain [Rhodoluna sp. KAS3]